MTTRQTIRNTYLCESVETLTDARQFAVKTNNADAVIAIQEMIDQCEKHGVENFGDCPMM